MLWRPELHLVSPAHDACKFLNGLCGLMMAQQQKLHHPRGNSWILPLGGLSSSGSKSGSESGRNRVGIGSGIGSGKAFSPKRGLFFAVKGASAPPPPRKEGEGEGLGCLRGIWGWGEGAPRPLLPRKRAPFRRKRLSYCRNRVKIGST